MFSFFKKKTFKVKKATTMGELLQHNPATADILIQYGMHCVGCPSHASESLEQACMVHGINCDELLPALQSYLDAHPKA